MKGKYTQIIGYWSVLLALLCVSHSVCANAVTAPLHDEADFYLNLKDHSRYYIDDTSALEVNEIIEGQFDFAEISSKYIDFGLTQSRVWLKTSLQNTAAKSVRWRLTLNRQYNRESRVYLHRRGAPTELLLFNAETMAFSERPIAHPIMLVDFELSARETADVYIAYRSNNTTFLPIGVGSPTGVMQQLESGHAWNALLNGALLCMIIIATLLGRVIGWSLCVSFALYIAAGMVYVFNADGYNFQYFWPNSPQLNDPMNMALMLCMSFFGLNFCQQVFDLKKHAPRYSLVLTLFMGLTALFALLAVPAFGAKWFMVTGYFLVPIASILQLASGVYAMRQRLLGAVPYTLGAIVVVSSLIYATLAHLVPGRYDLDFTLDYGHFALFTECIAFGAAIVLRILGLRDERDWARAAQIKALQDKLELTSELHNSQKKYIRVRKKSDLRRIQIENLNHDIQQPLNSLRAAISKIDGANEATIEQLNSAFDYLESIALHENSEMAEGNPNPENANEVFSIDVILSNIESMFFEDAFQKGIQLRVRSSLAKVRTTPLDLMRITSNLVANAINNTERGGVLVAARIRPTHVDLEVWDTGLGIKDTEIEHYFEPHAKSKTSKGEGLGLSIVKSLSTRNQLPLDVISKPGQGTRFRVSIPRTV